MLARVTVESVKLCLHPFCNESPMFFAHCPPKNYHSLKSRLPPVFGHCGLRRAGPLAACLDAMTATEQSRQSDSLSVTAPW